MLLIKEEIIIDKETNYMQEMIDFVSEGVDLGNLSKAESAYLSELNNLRNSKIIETGVDEQQFTLEALLEYLRFRTKRYATGGLNTETGPAWLDGTKSKPELVLNATDTQHFIELRDALRGLDLSNISKSGIYDFDIDINVDEIANDYDVDQLSYPCGLLPLLYPTDQAIAIEQYD